MILVKPASDLSVGDVFSTDGYRVTVAMWLRRAGRVYVEAVRDDDPAAKTASLPADFPCPIYREEN